MEQQTVDGITAFLVSLAHCGCGISKGGLKYKSRIIINKTSETYESSMHK